MSVIEKCTSYTRAREAKAAGLYPYFLNFDGRDAGTARMTDGREVVMCGSNDYLGLSTDPRVVEAAARAAHRHGAGCTGSRFLNGNLELHDQLERELAQFFGKPAALVLTTGYQANLGAIAGLCGPGDIVFLDKEAHASLIDAARLSRARIQWFAHNDAADLEAKLARVAGGSDCMVVVDGVYSMEGDLCPLPELVDVCEKYGATLLVDDAHGGGVLDKGRGTASHFALTDRVPLITLTFSKAFGSIGGAVLGDEEVIDFLRHNARSLMFSASASPSNTAAALESLRILQNEPWRCSTVADNADFMRRELTELGYEVGDSRTPIVPVATGDDISTLLAWNLLIEQGVYVNAVLPPAASPRLRTSYTAVQTEEQLARAVEGFRAVRDRILRVPVGA
ncbi:aminotransferase class I/II-fold pyridoxal phosphate-dependent enzyme [Streptomyces virginiae]|uniref:aminotransferase class I/II-fold pyridoxal phosphate-dependent enzyme n=1 Tax=Streptomyces virginiae TaxID=1961 RepID=UPI00224F647D|nr:pyridoxal phosphate-dependent aminotransferase family protein [Streptomyces virginiae]MCX4960129.1 pyridoxal phosphate-dependent aminotransferase family protein [Streptomyces virginiae]